MEQNIFDNSNGLAIYQVISFIIFFMVFLGVAVWIFIMDKNYVKKMSEIPLDNNNEVELIEGEKL